MEKLEDLAAIQRRDARERADKLRARRAGSLAFVLDASAELLNAARLARVGTDRQLAAIRALRLAASRQLDDIGGRP
jgi:hypothetical protein